MSFHLANVNKGAQNFVEKLGGRVKRRLAMDCEQREFHRGSAINIAYELLDDELLFGNDRFHEVAD